MGSWPGALRVQQLLGTLKVVVSMRIAQPYSGPVPHCGDTHP